MIDYWFLSLSLTSYLLIHFWFEVFVFPLDLD